MTGRDCGGNYVLVLFSGLHFAWVDLLVLERIDLLTNYTNMPKLDRSFSGPGPKSPYRIGTQWIELRHPRQVDFAGGNSRLVDRRTRRVGHLPAVCDEQPRMPRGYGLPFEDSTNLHFCPYHWAKPSHQMLCDIIWRPDLQRVTNPKNAVYKIELNTPEYAGRVRDEKIVERQLAKV
ncbi:unnamed protein product [Rhizoctonia solani]|uniref:Uncharacterized protein n=1 Tax=Rhizoctonia solani TaxID=456999 RepID=A0A8H2WIV2_9AGAM|nr:unnamed protein product [Rhizoctonia solani]